MSWICEDSRVRDIIRRSVEEDVGPGDATSLALVPSIAAASGTVVSRVECVVAGTEVADMVFQSVDPNLHCTVHIRDGECVKAGASILSVRGPARAILTAERTALNFLQRLCGIATLTRQFVNRVQAHNVMILDTRKTTPGLRILEKYAVVCGGGRNHRMGLYDRVLIKDNHRVFWGNPGSSRLGDAVKEARRHFPNLLVEVEVESVEELISAMEANPDWILADNMTPDQLREIVRIVARRALVEASGGITLANVESMASTGVDAISLGCLTHSAPAVDLSLEIQEFAS